MQPSNPISLAKAAVLALAEVKSAVEAFDRGDRSVYDTLDDVVVAVEAYRSLTQAARAAA